MNAGGQPLYWSTSSTTANYLHWDPLGSVRNVTNASGATQLTYDYEPYGTIRTSSGTLTNFVKFTGQYQDPTGLYHLRARQYDPASGRFTATDPAGQTIGGELIGPYQYAAGQPTVMVDPAGTWSTRADVASSAAETAASGYEPLVLVRPTCPSGTRWFSELGRCVEVNAGVVEPPFVRVPRIAIRLGSFWAWRAIRGAKAAKAGASALEEASEAAFRASRGPINISRKHYPGAGGRHSKFEQGVDIDATVREALQSPAAIFRPNRNAAGDIIPGYRIYTDLGRTVGTRGETGLRTIVSPDGRIITSFPGKPWG